MKIGKIGTAAMALLMLSGCGEADSGSTSAGETISESTAQTAAWETAGTSAETETGTSETTEAVTQTGEVTSPPETLTETEWETDEDYAMWEYFRERAMTFPIRTPSA